MIKSGGAVCLVSISLAGCGQDDTSPWHGDVTFSLEDRATIEASEAWIAGHVGREPRGVVWDAPHQEADCTDGQSSLILKRDRGIGGCFTRTDWCIYLGPTNPLDALSAHEFGHYYHLHHVDPSSRSVMNPTPYFKIWTDAEQEQLAK